MSSEQKFLELVAQARSIAKSARLLDLVVHDHYLVGFDAAPGCFLVVHGNATPAQLSVALAVRQVEHEARQTFLRAQQAARQGLIHTAVESVQ